MVSSFGRRLLVEDEHAERHQCLLARKRLRPVTGDWVNWRRAPRGDDGVVLEILPRKNELTRPDRRGRTEILAANITQLAVIVAPIPAPDPFLVDRYLASAHGMAAAAAVVFNKADLREEAGGGQTYFDPQEFAAIGYPVLRVSAKTGAGLDRLAGALAGQTSILVGQSGVGKSSLINALLPDADILTAEVSRASGEGRHTTTASTLHHLPGGGEIIDSPGVRDYAPGVMEEQDVAAAYREFDPYAGMCQFANCRHMEEPGCAIKRAIGEGKIAARRHESYRRMLRLMRTLAKKH